MSWSADPEASSLQSDETHADKTLSSCWRSRNLSTESLSMLKRLRVRSLPAEDRNTDQHRNRVHTERNTVNSKLVGNQMTFFLFLMFSLYNTFIGNGTAAHTVVSSEC